MPPNDQILKNEYGFTVYEFDQSSYSTPKNRTTIQIIITLKIEVLTENEFISICTNISNNFIKYHIENIRKQIDYKLKNIELLDSETKTYIQSCNNIFTDVNLISTFEFYRTIENISLENYSFSDHFTITPNNYIENDLDFYYNFSEKIINERNWKEELPQENQNNINSNFEDADQTDNLIDELFDSIKNN